MIEIDKLEREALNGIPGQLVLTPIDHPDHLEHIQRLMEMEIYFYEETFQKFTKRFVEAFN